MNGYTIYCTEEQTKKALELGAPIETFPHYGELVDDYDYDENEYYVIGHTAFVTPTAEQMIGWLEAQNLAIDIIRDNAFYKAEIYFDKKSRKDIFDFEYIENGYFERSSRKEVVLAAINAALEYLTTKKK